MNKKIFAVLFLFVLFLAGLIFYKENLSTKKAGPTAQNSSASATPKLRIEATFYPLAEFAEQVGGDLVAVNTLVPAGSEPHDFEPTTQDIARMHQSKIYIYNGAGFEGWLNKVIPDLQKSGVITVDSSQGIPLLAADPTIEEGKSATDPHIWLDPVLAQHQVKTIEAALIQVDPTHRTQYEQNAAAYIEKLHALDLRFKTVMITCDKNEIVTSHAAFAYLAKEYGLNVLPIAGLSPDEEPSPQRLAQIAQQVKKDDIKYIFFESLVQPTLANTIATETGAKTLVFNPLEGLTPEDISSGKEYISVQDQNLQNLRVALECQ